MQPKLPQPALCDDHMARAELSKFYSVRLRPVIYLGIIRDPLDRWISLYYFSYHSKCLKTRPADECDSATELWRFFNNTANYAYQYQYLTPDYHKSGIVEPMAALGSDGRVHRGGVNGVPHALVFGNVTDQTQGSDDEVRRMLREEVLSGYSLLLVTERMDESLVVLKHKLDLPSLTDVLYFSSKTKPTKFHKKGKLEDFPPILQAHLKSAEYRGQHRYSSLLHELAREALDCEIRILGEAFQRDLARFQEMMGAVRRNCPLKNKDCYIKDHGCQRTCMNRVVAEFPGW